MGSTPGLGRSPGKGKVFPLQDSGLENSMDHIVHGVAKSQTQLSDFHSLFLYSFSIYIGQYRALNRVPCAIQHIFINYLFYI